MTGFIMATVFAAVTANSARTTLNQAVREVYDLELTPPKVNVAPGSEFSRTNMTFAMNGGMAMTAGGRIWSVWHSGEDGPKAHLVGTWSDDDGRTWQETRISLCSAKPLFSCAAGCGWCEEDRMRIRLSCIVANVWMAPDGTLRLYAMVAVNGFDGRGALYEYVCHNPDAEKPVWDDGKLIGWGGAHNKPQVLSDGTWIIPNDFESMEEKNFPELDPLRGCGLLASSDGGKTWVRRGYVKPKGTNHYAEHQVAELADRSLLMYMRTGLGLMESRSRDGGRTWTQPEEPKSLRQIVSRFVFEKLPNGHLLFVKNGNGPMLLPEGKDKWWSKRRELTAFVSDDEGKTWKGGLVLDPRERVAYPDAFVSPKGFVYVSYDHDRMTGAAELLFAKFTEADVLAGRLVNPESRLQNVVFSSKRKTFNAVLSDPLDWLYADSRTPNTPALAELDAPANGVADVDVLVEGLEPGRPLEISASGSAAGGDWYRMRAVPVTRNTGVRGFLEMNGQINPHVTRRAPFSVFDVLEPLPARSVADPQATEALWLRLRCSPLGVGEHALTVRISQGAKVVERTVKLRVHQTRLPAVGRGSFKYTNWLNVGNMAGRHGLKPDSEEHWAMIERYLACVAAARQNMLLVPRDMIFEKDKDGRISFAKSKFERLLRLCDRYGLWYLEGPHLAGFTHGWGSPNFHPLFSTNLTTSAAGEAELRHLAGIIRHAVDAYELKDRWYQHVADEPSRQNAGEYIKTAEIVRSCLPGVRTTDAIEQPGFESVVDAPCPKVDMYEKHRAAFAAAHEKPWVYTCCIPGGKWMNRLLDGELLKPVLLPWVCTLEGADAFLHWGGNQYQKEQDPFRDTFPPKWQGANGGNSVPPGDTHVIYPGQGAPWPSVRLEATRSGMEDADLLLMLRARDAAKAEALVRRIARGFGDYTPDVKLYRRVRRDLLDALDETADHPAQVPR